jgi:hypothetical protein
MDNGVTPSNNFADAQSPAVRYDANGDKKVWVKASATVRSRTRTVVGLMQLEQLTLPFPRFVVQSYSLNLKDKPGAVNTNGGGAVHLGCSGYGSGCANWDPNGGAVVGGTQFGFGSNLQALTDSQQAALKTAAKTEGHYCEIPGNASDTNSLSPGFTCTAAGCPVEIGNTTGSGDGWIVWADGPTGQCKYNGGTNYNSLAKPGMLVIGQGPGWIEVTGNATFYGVLYAVNRQKVSTPALLQWHGNGSMVGAAASDFNGSIDMCCSSQADFTFDANALKGVKVNGTAGLAQNTWREL